MVTGALIPCRTGSKGIPNKNFRSLCGKPLWHWTLDAAIESEVFTKIIVSSDGGIKNSYVPMYTHLSNNGLVIDDNRPEELSDDKVSLDEVLVHYCFKNPEIDLWCLLQPTSPLRTVRDILNAYEMMQEKEKDGKEKDGSDYKYDSLVSVTPNHVFGWVDKVMGLPNVDEPQPIAIYPVRKRPNRQDRKDWYLENGAIYFTRKYVIEHLKCRLHGFIGLYVMPKERSFEIDDPFDWELSEFLMGRARELA